MKDKGIIYAEWFPLNYNDFPKQKPIIVFICGIFGSSVDFYVKKLASMIEKRGWRFVLLNRRGFDRRELENSVFLCKNEMKDF